MKALSASNAYLPDFQSNARSRHSGLSIVPASSRFAPAVVEEAEQDAPVVLTASVSSVSRVQADSWNGSLANQYGRNDLALDAPVAKRAHAAEQYASTQTYSERSYAKSILGVDVFA